MNFFPIIRVVSKLLIPYIILFGFYVQFHGDFGPGGGFQAGVVIAAAIILYGLVFGLGEAMRVAPPWLVEKAMALGVVLYVATGLIGIAGGRTFLDYESLNHGIGHHWIPTGQHLGIFLVELGVGLTVTSVMTMIFFVFASRPHPAQPAARGPVSHHGGEPSQDPGGDIVDVSVANVANTPGTDGPSGGAIKSTRAERS